MEGSTEYFEYVGSRFRLKGSWRRRSDGGRVGLESKFAYPDAVEVGSTVYEVVIGC